MSPFKSLNSGIKRPIKINVGWLGGNINTPNPMPFRFDSQTFFLTYAQSGDLTTEEIRTHLESIRPLHWVRIAKEQHESGDPHFHVVGKFKGRFASRNERVFDIRGKHPNIQPVRSIGHSLEYCTKDGEFTDFGPVPGTANSQFDIMAAAATLPEIEYWKACMRAKVGYMYANKFWDIYKRSKACEIDESYQPDLTRESLELLCQTYHPEKATVIVGPTGAGKTSWAKRVCPKPALWVRHMDVLRSFRPEYHKSIVFDDMSFKHLPREAQIHICDWNDEAHIHCRYGHATIPAGVVKIFTANEYPFSEDAAIERRVHKIELIAYG